MTRLFAVLCALAALSAHADTLTDIKTAVSRLSAKTPVRATFTTEQKMKAEGKFANKASTRLSSVEVTNDQNGLTLMIPQAAVEKSKHDSSAESALDSIRVMPVIEALDYHAGLLELLASGKVSEEKRVAFRGKPARVVVLQINAPREEKSNEIVIGSVKKGEDRLTLWIGDDNVPLAAERSQKTTAGFLMFHSDTVSKSSYSFAVAADRLIIARYEEEGTGSGMGQTIAAHTVQTVTLH